MIEISKREEFYQQEYCGCAYSLRDTNLHRRASGRTAIVIWTQFYHTATDEDRNQDR
jgi:epoxyqueuosine reductase